MAHMYIWYYGIVPPARRELSVHLLLVDNVDMGHSCVNSAHVEVYKR